MRGRGSAGRASPCQGEGRGFESRRPLGASLAQSLWGEVFPGGVAERRGNGLQIRVHGFKSRLHLGRLAQWERASLTRKRSLVQIQYRPPVTPLVRAISLAPRPSLGAGLETLAYLTAYLRDRAVRDRRLRASYPWDASQGAGPKACWAHVERSASQFRGVYWRGDGFPRYP
jgi:hypothetical protein